MNYVLAKNFNVLRIFFCVLHTLSVVRKDDLYHCFNGPKSRQKAVVIYELHSLNRTDNFRAKYVLQTISKILTLLKGFYFQSTSPFEQKFD